MADSSSLVGQTISHYRIQSSDSNTPMSSNLSLNRCSNVLTDSESQRMRRTRNSHWVWAGYLEQNLSCANPSGRPRSALYRTVQRSIEASGYARSDD